MIIDHAGADDGDIMVMRPDLLSVTHFLNHWCHDNDSDIYGEQDDDEYNENFETSLETFQTANQLAFTWEIATGHTVSIISIKVGYSCLLTYTLTFINTLFLGFSLLNSIVGYLCLNPVFAFYWKYKYVSLKVCIKIRPKKRVNATKLMSRQKHGTTT